MKETQVVSEDKKKFKRPRKSSDINEISNGTDLLSRES
jgi:hypothetical protein